MPCNIGLRYCKILLRVSKSQLGQWRIQTFGWGHFNMFPAVSRVYFFVGGKPTFIAKLNRVYGGIFSSGSATELGRAPNSLCLPLALRYFCHLY